MRSEMSDTKLRLANRLMWIGIVVSIASVLTSVSCFFMPLYMAVALFGFNTVTIWSNVWMVIGVKVAATATTFLTPFPIALTSVFRLCRWRC